MAEDTIQSVARAFSILEQLAAQGEMGVRELHGATGLSVTTVHRILGTLTELGYVRQNENTSRYGLTYKMLALGQRVPQHSTVIQLAHPLLQQLSEQACETIHFAERSDTNIRYIDKVIPSSGVVVMGSCLGMELAMYSTAVGKSMMADMSRQEVEDIWSRSQIITYTPNTVSSLPELERQLEECRLAGVSYDWEEREPGISCVAVDILDVTGRPAYAVSISSSDARMRQNQDRYADLLREVKVRLTELIGYSL